MPVNVISNLIPKNGGSFPVTEDTYVKGGWQSVADNTARDAIPVERRKEGMAVFVRSSDTIYTLGADLTTWSELETGGGGGGGDVPNVSDSEAGIVPALNGAAGEVLVDTGSDEAEWRQLASSDLSDGPFTTPGVVDDSAAGLAPQTNGQVGEVLVDDGSGTPAWRALTSSDLSDVNDLATVDMLQVKMTGDITLAVNVSTGDDTPGFSGRPSFITTGDHSADPFATVAAALASVPKETNGFYLRVNVAANASAQDGWTISGFVGGGVVDIVGALVQSTVTGSNGGTAGTGTTSTAVKKPTAASNWVAGALKGKLFVPTSGAGYFTDTIENMNTHGGIACQRRIIDNTTDTLTIEALSGIDNTTVFQIMESGVTFDEAATDYQGLTYCVGAFGNVAHFLLRNFKAVDTDVLWGILGQSNTYAELHSIETPASAFSGVGFYDTGNLTSSQCYASGSVASYHDYYDGGRLTVNGFVEVASRMDVTHFSRAVGKVYATSCANNAALRVRHCQFAAFDLTANSCTITPLVLLNNAHFETASGVLVGTNAGTSYFVSVGGGGQYKFTGATGAGSSGTQVIVEGDTTEGLFSWAELALGTYCFRGNVLYWGAGPTRWVGPTSGYRGDINEVVDTDLVVDNTMSGTVQEMNSDDPHTVTLHKTAKKGFSITIVQTGTGQVTVAPETDATMVNIDSHDKTAGRWAMVMAYVSKNSDGSSAEWVFGGRTAS